MRCETVSGLLVRHQRSTLSKGPIFNRKFLEQRQRIWSHSPPVWKLQVSALSLSLRLCSPLNCTIMAQGGLPHPTKGQEMFGHVRYSVMHGMLKMLLSPINVVLEVLHVYLFWFVTASTTATTPKSGAGTEFWEKAIDLVSPLGTFIIAVVSLGLLLILLIALIVVCVSWLTSVLVVSTARCHP